MEADNKEKFNKEFNDVLASEKEALNEINNIGIKNIELTRNFWLNILILSSAIIVAIFPLILRNQTYFKCIELAIYGIIFLVVTDIIGICYINFLLVKDNKIIDEHQEFRRNNFSEQKEILAKGKQSGADYDSWFNDVYSQFLLKFGDEEKSMRAKLKGGILTRFFDRYFSTIFTFLITIGILLISLSFVI